MPNDNVLKIATLGRWRGPENPPILTDTGQIRVAFDAAARALSDFHEIKTEVEGSDSLTVKGKAEQIRQRALALKAALEIQRNRLPAIRAGRDKLIADKLHPVEPINPANVLRQEIRAMEARAFLAGLGDPLKIAQALMDAAQAGDWGTIQAAKDAPSFLKIGAPDLIAKAERTYFETRHPELARQVEELDTALADAEGALTGASQFIQREIGDTEQPVAAEV